jgi:hypothetical protein
VTLMNWWLRAMQVLGALVCCFVIVLWMNGSSSNGLHASRAFSAVSFLPYICAGLAVLSVLSYLKNGK